MKKIIIIFRFNFKKLNKELKKLKLGHTTNRVMIGDEPSEVRQRTE